MIALSAALALVLVAEALPTTGYVDLNGLLRADSRWTRVERLEQGAARLRRLAAGLHPAEVPAVPPDEVYDQPPEFVLAPSGFEAKAEALELELLRQALWDQITYRRRRRRIEQAAGLHDDLVDRLRDSRRAWRAWERALGESQQVALIQADIQLRADRAALDPEPIRREGMITAQVADALAAARRAELADGLTRRTRLDVALQEADLELAAKEEEAAAERLIATRRDELAADTAARDDFLRQRRDRPDWLEVELTLDHWREVLGERPAANAARVDELRARCLAAAAGLEAEAKQLRESLARTLRPRLLAWLKVIERADGVRLATAPAAGLPNVTTAVARRIAALEADPAQLAPQEEMPWP